MTFSDPDSTSLSLVGVAGAETEDSWSGGPIAAEQAIRGFHGVTLKLEEAGPTGAILTDVLGFQKSGHDEGHVRFKAESSIGGIVDIHEANGSVAGRMGRGSVHHVAFRAKDDAEQTQMVKKLTVDHRLATTEQKDRDYFRSVYFREPGGVLFEIATDDPGFAVDEPLETLGTELKLPAFLEPRRRELKEVLPHLEVAR